MTQEFRLSVTPLGGDDYLVQIENKPDGAPNAQEQVTWPVEAWLNQASVLMNDPLQGLLRGETLHTLPTGLGVQAATQVGAAANLVALGQTLYKALFQRSILDSWKVSQGIAQHRHEVLRLRLGLKEKDADTRLLRLPWEVMYADDRPLATGTDVLFSRYYSTFADPSFQIEQTVGVQPHQALRILMVLAVPTDQTALALKQEAQNLQAELQQRSERAGQTAKIELTILEQPDCEQLTQTLENKHEPYHVFHYAGHSNSGAAGGSLSLVNCRTGLTETLNGNDLAGLLVNNGIRLAVFNSCRGFYTATADAPQGNLADALVKQGVPAVLAMSERIPDAVALNLSRLFYRNLKQAFPIDLSLSRARQGLISSYGSKQLYWALPILYLTPKFDGCLQRSALAGKDELAITTGILEPPLREPMLAGVRSSDPQMLVATAEFEADTGEFGFNLDELEYEDPEQVLETQISDLVNELTQPPAAEWVQERTLLGDDAESLLLPAAPLPYPAEQPVRFSAATESAVPVQTQLHTPVGSAVGLDEDLYTDLEQMLLDAGKLTSEIAASFRAVRLNRQSAEVHQALGWTLQQQGYIVEAIAVYSQALRLNPNLAEVHNQLGMAQMQQGAYDKALQAFLQAVKLSPNLSEAYQNLELARQKLGNSKNPWERQLAMLPIEADAQAAIAAAPLDPPDVATPAHRSRVWLWAGLGTLATGLLLGSWLLYSQIKQRPVPVPLPALTEAPAAPSPAASAAASVATLASRATEQLNQGNVAAAQPAIVALLDQGVLDEVKQILTSVQGKYANDPTINFLMGRHAWQRVKTGDSAYSLSDVLLYWNAAAKQPDPVTQNALGFAYYEDNQADRANQAWSKTLELPEQASATESTRSKAVLTAYAGLALSLVKLAANQPPSKRSSLITEAVRLRQQVLAHDVSGFQPEALSKDWMWSETAIQDWRSLLSIQSPGDVNNLK